MSLAAKARAPESARPLGGIPVRAQGSATTLRPPANDYAELKRLVEQQGLLDKQPAFYARHLLLMLGLLAASAVLLTIMNDPWLRLLNAPLWAFVFAQIAFDGHDAGHRAILGNARLNDLLALVLINLLLGASRGWWVAKHNRHHGNPNQLGVDPDIDFPVLAFAEEQARAKTGVFRFVVAYQAFFFFPLLLLEAFNMRYHSTVTLVRTKPRYFAAECILLAVHAGLYFGGLVLLLGVGLGLLFILIHQALFGLYLGATFAENHKGMPILGADTRMGFLRRQVLTARNLNPHPATDFFFGPLGTQIEHHLFPLMPRSRCRAAAPIVQAFCRERSIAYHQTSILQAYREILHHPARGRRAPARGTGLGGRVMATRQQIEETYNYQDEICRLTLGETADITCAFFDGDYSKSLPQAQRDKHRYVLDAVNFRPGQRLLDIGCGWGPMLQAARERGGHGIGLTLSTKQAESCRRNGLEAYLHDWKDVGIDTYGPFDAVVSIGAFEHFCSVEEFEAGQQEAIYDHFFRLCRDLLPDGGRLYLQTMLWGKNAPALSDVSLEAEPGSNAYILAVLGKYYPGSWLPHGEEAVIRAAAPYFSLVSKKNGRLDYIETLNRFGVVWDASPRKVLLAVKLLPSFVLDRDFRYKVESLRNGYNKECFKREVMDHQRMVFEKRSSL